MALAGISKENFDNWCSAQERNLWKRKIVQTSGRIFIVFLILALWMFLVVILLVYLNNSLLFLISLVVLFLLLSFIGLKILNWAQTMSEIDYISCLLNLFVNSLTRGSNDHKKIKKILRKLYSASKKMLLSLPLDPELFKEQYEIEKKFYVQLKELPLRINYVLSNKKISDLNTYLLGDIAYQMHIDGKDKTAFLDSFTKKYPETKKIDLLFENEQIRKLAKNRTLLFFLWTLLCIALFWSLIKYIAFIGLTVDGFLTALITIYLGGIALYRRK